MLLRVLYTAGLWKDKTRSRFGYSGTLKEVAFSVTADQAWTFQESYTMNASQNGQRPEKNMAEEPAGNKVQSESSYTRVSAKSNTRKRFVGTKSIAGQKTDKLAGTLSVILVLFIQFVSERSRTWKLIILKLKF